MTKKKNGAQYASQVYIINLLIGFIAWKFTNTLDKKTTWQQGRITKWSRFIKVSLFSVGVGKCLQNLRSLCIKSRKHWFCIQGIVTDLDLQNELDFSDYRHMMPVVESGTYLFLTRATIVDNDKIILEYLLVNGIISATTICINELTINKNFPSYYIPVFSGKIIFCIMLPVFLKLREKNRDT